MRTPSLTYRAQTRVDDCRTRTIKIAIDVVPPELPLPNVEAAAITETILLDWMGGSGNFRFRSV